MLASSAFSAKPVNPDVETLRQRFIQELLKPQVNPDEITKLMTTLQENGTWPGINYEDVSRTGFQHGQHLHNLVELSIAYKKKGSKFRGNKQLKAVIYKALDFWLANDFICENWWWNQIGTPDALVSVLLIMDTDLTKEQVDKMLPIVGRANLTASGARPSGDRIKIAGILAKTLLFERDEEEFDKVVKVIEGEIKFATGRGMQYDLSFHHRVDRVNNTLSYGTNYASAFAEWAANVSGTRYQFSEKSLQMLTDYYLDGICKMLAYGKYPDPGAKNRGITREGDLRPVGTNIPEELLKAGTYRANELVAIIKVREGIEKPAPAYSKFFWNSEYFSFQRPKYFTSVRMFSSRDYNMEEPYNGEGLMNHHLPDGSNFITVTGNEYLDIWPIYDWQKIPGTTVLQTPELPSDKEIQKKGLTDFVGGVTDGKYGASVFDFKSPHDPVSAKKTWFFFDHEYVCLGTAIQAETRFPVVTTLNQCGLRGDVTAMAGNKQSVIETGDHQLDHVKWIFHDGVGYLFPTPQKVNLSNQNQTGSWYKINHQSDSPKDVISKPVFKLWLDEGTHPQDTSYAYIVVPATTVQEMAAGTDAQKIRILSNTPDIQAVTHTGLNISEVVFYTSGEIRLSNFLKLGMESPGMVMVKTDGAALKSISVSDPSRKLSRLHLTVSQEINKSGKNFVSVWNKEKGVSEIAVDLPQTVYAGESVTIEL